MRDAHLKSRARTRTVDVLDAKPHDIVWVCAAADLPTQGGDYRVVKRDRLRQALVDGADNFRGTGRQDEV
jgi:hypothetical protein